MDSMRMHVERANATGKGEETNNVGPWGEAADLGRTMSRTS